MAMQAGRKGVNPAEVNNRGFLRNVLRAMKIKIVGTIKEPDDSGYVNIPYAGPETPGVIRLGTTYGGFITSGGYLSVAIVSESSYGSIQDNYFISKGTLENNKYNLIKSVLTDTTTNIWTDAERLAVLSRLGCSVDSETGAVTWTAQE